MSPGRRRRRRTGPGAPGEAEVEPFDLERQPGHVVRAERKLEGASKRLDQGDDQGGGGA